MWSNHVLADPAAVGRGLVARFSFIAPRTWVGHRELQPPACDPFAVQWWQNALVRLLDLPWPGKVVSGTSQRPCRRHRPNPAVAPAAPA